MAGATIPAQQDRVVLPPTFSPAYLLGPWCRPRFGSNGSVDGSHGADNLFSWLANVPALTALSPSYAVIEKVNANFETAFKWYGTGADNATFTAKIWGLKQLNGGIDANKQNVQEVLGDPLCLVALTLGAGTVSSSRVIGNGDGTIYRMVDVVSVTKDWTIDPGVFVVGQDRVNSNTPATDAWQINPILDKAPGYFGYIVQLVLGTATGAGFLYTA